MVVLENASNAISAFVEKILFVIGAVITDNLFEIYQRPLIVNMGSYRRIRSKAS